MMVYPIQKPTGNIVGYLTVIVVPIFHVLEGTIRIQKDAIMYCIDSDCGVIATIPNITSDRIDKFLEHSLDRELDFCLGQMNAPLNINIYDAEDQLASEVEWYLKEEHKDVIYANIIVIRRSAENNFRNEYSFFYDNAWGMQYYW